MTDDDLDNFIERLAGLYPEKVTAEQADVWRAYCRRLECGQAVAALNEYFASEKTGTPNLGRFRAKVTLLLEGKPGDSTRCHPHDPEWVHTLRHCWMKEHPSRAGEFDSMPTAEVELEHAQGVFVDAVKFYRRGKGEAMSRHRFDQWQKLTTALGYAAADYDAVTDSILAREAAYAAAH